MSTPDTFPIETIQVIPVAPGEELRVNPRRPIASRKAMLERHGVMGYSAAVAYHGEEGATNPTLVLFGESSNDYPYPIVPLEFASSSPAPGYALVGDHRPAVSVISTESLARLTTLASILDPDLFEEKHAAVSRDLDDAYLSRGERDFRDGNAPHRSAVEFGGSGDYVSIQNTGDSTLLATVALGAVVQHIRD